MRCLFTVFSCQTAQLKTIHFMTIIPSYSIIRNVKQKLKRYIRKIHDP